MSTSQSTLHDHAGSSRAELLVEAKKKVDSIPLEEAILQYPVETWGVWSSIHPRKYFEDSEVCNALPAEHEVDGVVSTTPDACPALTASDACLPVIAICCS